MKQQEYLVFHYHNFTQTKADFRQEKKLNEQVVNDIANNFSDADQDPIHVWTDPKDGKTYVLSGHHRYYGAEKAGKDSLYTEALTQTENILRNAKAHREFWEGRLNWIENLRKQFEDVTTPSEDGELRATEDMYGNYEIISKAIGTASKAVVS